MDKLNIDSYIETMYYQLKGENGHVDVTEFNMSFATNPFYNSGSPLARHGYIDIMAFLKERKDVDYSSEFADYLISLDKTMVTERVAFYSLMRAYLPSFKLLDKDGNEYKVTAFATFYEDGFFSVTHIYKKLKMTFEENCLEKIYNWKDISFIKFDTLTAELLKLEFPEDVKKDWDKLKEVGLPIDDFLKMFSGDKFSIGKETVLRILEEGSKHSSGGNWSKNAILNNYRTPFSYLILRCDFHLRKVNTANIANILSRRGNSDFVNEQLCDMGTDLTAAPNTIMRGYRNFLYTIHKSEEELDPNILLVMFTLFDACLIEKIKYMYSIKAIRELVYFPKTSPADINKLIYVRHHQLTTGNDGYCYEYQDELLLTVKAIRECLGIEDYKHEYEHFCNIAEELIIKHNELRHQKERNRQTKALSILTLILTIPSVIGLVDIFYGLEIEQIIYCPINKAKLFWVTIALISSLYLIYKNTINQKIVVFCKNLNAKCKKKDEHQNN